MTKRILLVGALMFVIGALFWLFQSEHNRPALAAAAPDESRREEAEKAAAPVAVAQITLPRRGAVLFDPVVVTPCNVVPLHEQNLSSQVDGLIEEMRVDLGDQVKRGDLLARLDDRQVRPQVDLL